MVKGLALLLFFISSVLSVEVLSQRLYRLKEGTLVAEGDVYVEYREYIIKSDRIEYDPRKKKIKAYGNVLIVKKDGTFEVKGTEAFLDLNTETGYFLKAKGRFRKFYFRAKIIRKLGKNLYKVEDGDITTCPPDRREMKVCFWRARISEQYVFSFSNSLKLFGVPIAYTPLSVFPIGERRSGLLPPMVGSNTYNTFIYIQPFYWAISPDKDATFTFDYRDRQAKGGSFEFRQAFSWKDRLYLRLSYYKEPYPPAEWWIGRSAETFRENRFRIELKLGLGNWKLGLDIPSDPYFMEDVYFSRKKRSLPYTLSYITYSKSEENYYLFLNLRSFYDLTSNNNRRTLHLLPELSFYHRPKRIGNFFLSLTSSFTVFHRVEGMRTKRLVFTPRLDVPLRLGDFYSYTSFKFINNFYHMSGNTSYTDNRVTTFKLESRIPFFKTLNIGSFSFSKVFEALYTFSPENYDNPQFDSFDEVVRENNFKLRLSSSLSFKERNLMVLFLESGYNVLESYRFPTDGTLVRKNLLPIRFRTSFFPVKWLTLSEDMIYDANLGILARSVSTATLKLGKNHLRMSFISSRNSKNRKTTDQYSIGGELNLKGLVLGASLTKDNFTGQELYRKLYSGYRGTCWALKVDYRRTYYGREKGYIREVYVVFNVFNLKEFTLPLRRR